MESPPQINFGWILKRCLSLNLKCALIGDDELPAETGASRSRLWVIGVRVSEKRQVRTDVRGAKPDDVGRTGNLGAGRDGEKCGESVSEWTQGHSLALGATN